MSMPELGVDSRNRQSTGEDPRGFLDCAMDTCADHEGMELSYLCVKCDIVVCGHCAVVGKHKGHEPIVLAKDKAEEKKKQVLEKVEEVEKEFLPRALSYLKNVVEVREELCAQAKYARSKIELERKLAMETIETLVLQKLQEVEDMECARHKILDGDHDRVKKLCEDVKQAIEFGSRLAKEKTTSEEAMLPAWLALGARVNSLVSSKLGDTLPLLSNLEFEATTDKDQILKSDDMLGAVVTCDASAAHSFVVGGYKRRCDRNESVTFVVKTSDSQGKLLQRGGDLIMARNSQCPGDVMEDLEADILDNGDGSYRVTFTPHADGKYVFAQAR